MMQLQIDRQLARINVRFLQKNNFKKVNKFYLFIPVNYYDPISKIIYFFKILLKQIIVNDSIKIKIFNWY